VGNNQPVEAPKVSPENAVESTYIELIYECDEEGLRRAIEIDPAPLETRTEWGATVLHRAAQFGCRNLVEIFLDRGFSVNVRDSKKDTSLHCSCAGSKDTADVAELLLNRGADINARNTYGDSPLMVAALYSSERHVNLLLSRGANAQLKSRRKWCALDYATYQLKVDGLGDNQRECIMRIITALQLVA